METSFGVMKKWDMEFSVDSESIHDSTNFLLESQKEQNERYQTKIRSKIIEKTKK